VLDIIRKELIEIKEKVADKRRTVIEEDYSSIEDEDLIPKENIIITMTHNGYIKRLPVDTYRSQRRGGRGVQGMGTNEGDFVEHLFTTCTHDTVLFFTNKGKVYRLKGYEIPDFGRTAKGIPIINLLEIEKDEHITAIIPIREFKEGSYLLFVTKQGITKRTELPAFINIRRGGLIAIHFREDDELIDVRLTDGKKDVIIGTKKGMAIRFKEQEVRAMGRTAAGVRGIRLQPGDEVVGASIIENDEDVLVVTENGFGKRTPASEYRIQGRGGVGIKTVNITERNGDVVALKTVTENDDLMVITEGGILIRTSVSGISKMGRNTQGVTLIRLSEGEKVSSVALVHDDQEQEAE